MSESQEAIYPSLKDRVVFITGGASGIGGAITVLVNNAANDDRHTIDC